MTFHQTGRGLCAAVLLFGLLAGCGKGRAVVTLTIAPRSGTISGIDRLIVIARNQGDDAQPVEPKLKPRPFTLPPNVRLGLVFLPDHKGMTTISVEAVAADGTKLGTGSVDFDLEISQSYDLTVYLAGGSAPVDGGTDDQGGADPGLDGAMDAARDGAKDAARDGAMDAGRDGAMDAASDGATDGGTLDGSPDMGVRDSATDGA